MGKIPELLLLQFLLFSRWSSVPLMYPASFVFSIPSSAFVTLSCVNLFIGIITTITTFVLENFDDEELKYIASILRKVATAWKEIRTSFFLFFRCS